MKALNLEELKALVQRRTAKEVFACTSLPCGIPKGAITEISGAGKTEFALKLLAEHPELKVAWLEKSFSAYPFAFLQRKVALNRVLFVEAGEQVNWVTLQVLRAQLFSVVVVYSDSFDLKTLRRIQIASEKAQVSTIWLSNHPQNAWPISLQVKVQRESEGISSTIIKQRF
jgi:hypothetical protein